METLNYYNPDHGNYPKIPSSGPPAFILISKNKLEQQHVRWMERMGSYARTFISN